MNRLDTDTRSRLLATLVEGNGIRATARIQRVAINTVQKFIRDLAPAAWAFHDDKARGLNCQRVECDEAWAFVYARKKNVPAHLRGTFGWGDVWIYTAIDADTKIVPTWHLGERNVGGAGPFIQDLTARIEGRYELNTDGLKAYQSALVGLGADRIPDYAQVVKSYATPNGKWNDKENRYQQPRLTGITKKRVCGNPDVEAASTSYVERSNLGLRMSNGKCARLSNKHAKRAIMLLNGLDIYYTYYNYARPHLTLKGRTPAMAAGIMDRPMTLAELVALSN